MVLKSMFKAYEEKEFIRIRKKYLNKINNLEKEMINLTDNELMGMTEKFKTLIKNGSNLDDLIVESFAVVREASNRILKMRHFDVQLLCGIVLHQGRIAEMKTGEGKTLTATLPIYLNALSGDKVFVVTVNEYLAKRDSEDLKPLFDFLGLKIAFISDKNTISEKKELYKADIIYITNSELGFDYLRDNMVYNLEDKIQPDFAFAIVDEVDSVLIDEARTPLIISSNSDAPTNLYSITKIFTSSLVEDDYIVCKKTKSCILSASGIKKAENIFGMKNYSDIGNNEIRHYINQSLHAFFIMTKDVDYIVKDGKVLLIDESTGRIAEGRRYSNGLHQSIEAKENVEIEKETETLATITYQNFFKLFKKLSGMTGTGVTQQYEFNEIYNLDVIPIPTNKPILRKDKDDLLFLSEESKIKAIINDIKINHEIGRPLLICTPSVNKSEVLSNILKKDGITHNLLNAKNHELEANIISNAGKKNAVTIATNMAGRGTDIKLDPEVIILGGLKVIGTEKAENRRIDNQLKGRSGRQGDPGESQFYTSFEDKLIAFATEKHKSFLTGLDKNNQGNVTNKILLKIINNCQKNLESIHFEQRKKTIEYNNVTDFQRELLYKNRNEILSTIEFKPVVDNMVVSLVSVLVNNIYNEDNEDLISDIISIFEPIYLKEGFLNETDLINLNEQEIIDFISKEIIEVINNKFNNLEELLNISAKRTILESVDLNWKNQVNDLLNLRRDLRLFGYKECDPLQIYSNRAYELFEDKMLEIKKDTILSLLNFNLYYK